MSHPVFLSSSTLPRMPEGSRNEWRDFFGHGGELEANAFFPLFWRALFSEADIRHARFIDEHDIDDEASEIEREECLEDFGPDATYPYLVVDKPTALARLASRREEIVAAVGERYRPIYESFEALLAQGFAGHILLRTSGLPDAADAEQWLRTDIAALEKLDEARTLADLATDLSRHGANPVWLLAGIGASAAGPWPTPELSTLFSLPQRKPPRPHAGQQIEAQDRAPTPQPKRKSGGGWLESAFEWLAAVVAAGAALGTYVFTQSVWLAVLAFLCAAVVLGFALVKLYRPNS
ncbi:hypothetical protein [Variovorax sp. EL159]|uniref:hypothetical protein n=1 Tax=Variovorax sp. EL159 TaxID=1566270 RepID=UPI000889FDE6|nr:hypothetical protein [Variovorax sp. EL159]SCX47434.1 hypothetical protein SAMN03159363_1060 [Variovorax sp. EL159]